MSPIDALNKPAADSKKVGMARLAGRHALFLSGAILALAGYQITHGQPVDWAGLGVFAVLLLGAALAPYGIHITTQGRVDREVLAKALEERKP